MAGNLRPLALQATAGAIAGKITTQDSCPSAHHRPCRLACGLPPFALQVLLQLVAENNIVMTDIINKLGVHERFDIAWKHVNYGGCPGVGWRSSGGGLRLAAGSIRPLGPLLLECARVASWCGMSLLPSTAGGPPPRLGPAAAACCQVPPTDSAYFC